MAEIVVLRERLADSASDIDFHEGSANELLEVIQGLRERLGIERHQLLEMPPAQILDGISSWLEVAMIEGAEAAGDLSSFIVWLGSSRETVVGGPLLAPAVEGGKGGSTSDAELLP